MYMVYGYAARRYKLAQKRFKKAVQFVCVWHFTPKIKKKKKKKRTLTISTSRLYNCSSLSTPSLLYVYIYRVSIEKKKTSRGANKNSLRMSSSALIHSVAEYCVRRMVFRNCAGLFSIRFITRIYRVQNDASGRLRLNNVHCIPKLW